jgi:hypothetical protein
MKSIIKSLFGVYVVVGIFTLVMQFYYRYPNCSGAIGCGLSYGKGVVGRRFGRSTGGSSFGSRLLTSRIER